MRVSLDNDALQIYKAFPTKPGNYTNLWIRDFCPSQWFAKAQSESERPSPSNTPLSMPLPSTEIAGLISSYWGNGTPRQRFESAQIPCCITDLFLVFSITRIKHSKPPFERIISRKVGQSPAIFPMPHRACSLTLGLFSYSRWRNTSSPFLSMMD